MATLDSGLMSRAKLTRAQVGRTLTRAERRKLERASIHPGQHVVLRRPASEFVERVAEHTDPIRELLGEPPPGRSALDRRTRMIDA